MSEYAKVSVPKPLVKGLDEKIQRGAFRDKGFRSPTDAIVYATRRLLEEAQAEA